MTRPRMARPAGPRPGVPWVSMAWPGVARPGPFGRGPGPLLRPGQHRSAPAAALDVRLAGRTSGEDLVGPLALVDQAIGGHPPRLQPGRGQFGVLGVACPVPSRRRLVLADDRHDQRLALVEHGTRADQGRARVHEPAIGGLAVMLHPGQPDLVALTLDVQRMGAADVGDPDAARRESPRPAATIRSTPGPRPNTSRVPSATSIFCPDAVLTCELSGIVRSRISGTTSI